MMKKTTFWIVQGVVLGSYLLAYAWAAPALRSELQQDVTGIPNVPVVDIPREVPLRVEPLFDRPEMVSDEDLAAVLWQVRPKFERQGLRPNLVEHAIRIWSVEAEFNDPDVLSGQQMQDFLLDHSTFLLSWDDKATPLLEEYSTGVGVNWGKARSSSVHHDHMLACISEAGARLDSPVFLPSQRQMTLKDVLLESLYDFRLDERETEWTAMAFGLWLPPTRTWRAADGREMSFDLLAQRLIRGELEKGVCHGTHRVYSLMLLWRLDQEFDILSDEMADRIYEHLSMVRDLITESQFADGHWPGNWNQGAAALTGPNNDGMKEKIISTGHHLEWLALAPEELHPPREQMELAARWIVATIKSQTREEILARYTFCSHVGNALAMWRKTHPPVFWKQWMADHPDYRFEPPEQSSTPDESSSAAAH